MREGLEGDGKVSEGEDGVREDAMSKPDVKPDVLVKVQITWLGLACCFQGRNDMVQIGKFGVRGLVGAAVEVRPDPGNNNAVV